MTGLLDAVGESARAAARPERFGQVTQMVGMSIEVTGLSAAIGDGLVLGRDVNASTQKSSHYETRKSSVSPSAKRRGCAQERK